VGPSAVVDGEARDEGDGDDMIVADAVLSSPSSPNAFAQCLVC
jgi:hypothetical protein